MQNPHPGEDTACEQNSNQEYKQTEIFIKHTEIYQANMQTKLGSNANLMQL